MYRVVVESRGEHDNVVLGVRYCFTKRSVISLAVSFELFKCEYKIEKFVHIHKDIFAWSETEVSGKIWDKIYERLEGENENA